MFQFHNTNKMVNLRFDNNVKYSFKYAINMMSRRRANFHKQLVNLHHCIYFGVVDGINI